MITNFSLPSFLDKNTDKTQIYEVKKHLQMLEQQENALTFLNLFHDPELEDLESFSFKANYESNDEGGTYTYFSPRNIVSCSKDEEKEDELHDCLSDFLNDLDENFVHGFEGDKITSENIESLVARVMGQKEFKLWQDNINIIAEKNHLESNIQTNKESDAILKI